MLNQAISKTSTKQGISKNQPVDYGDEQNSRTEENSENDHLSEEINETSNKHTTTSKTTSTQSVLKNKSPTEEDSSNSSDKTNEKPFQNQSSTRKADPKRAITEEESSGENNSEEDSDDSSNDSSSDNDQSQKPVHKQTTKTTTSKLIQKQATATNISSSEEESNDSSYDSESEDPHTKKRDLYRFSSDEGDYSKHGNVDDINDVMEEGGSVQSDDYESDLEFLKHIKNNNKKRYNGKHIVETNNRSKRMRTQETCNVNDLGNPNKNDIEW